MDPRVRSFSAAALLLLAGALTLVALGDDARARDAAKKNNEAAATPQRRQQLQTEQRQLQQRLGRLKKQLADAEASHSDASDALSESEQAISVANRRLRDLAEARRLVERQIASVQDRARLVGVKQSAQEQHYGALLRAQLAVGRSPAWQSWLAGQPNGVSARDLHLLGRAADASAGRCRTCVIGGRSCSRSRPNRC